MTITQIQYFLAIIEHGNFSSAADEMYISHSSFSKQIKALELEVGSQLFTRSHHKVTLTASGSVFYKHAQKLNETYLDMNRELSLLDNNSITELISIGTLPLLHDYQISGQLAMFQQGLNSTQIDITESNQPRLLKLLDAHKIDMAIIRLDYLDFNLYDVTPIREDELVLVCSQKHKHLVSSDMASIKDFKDVPFVLLNTESDIYKLCEEQFVATGIQPKIPFTSSRHLYILSLVETGIGVTILPRDMVNTSMFPELIVMPYAESSTTSIGIVRNKGVIHPPSDLLCRYFEDHGLTPVISNH